MPELLSPAGSYEGFLAALKAGADAVYAGGELFGARAYARNFTTPELLEAIDVSHLHRKKLYLTVNTLCKERELDRLGEYLAPFYAAGLDGVIVQDLGVAEFIRDNFKGLPIHASTQMTITGLPGVLYAKSLGMRRVVPARELSLSEIKRIREKTDIELECFIHGAMCYSYSGQCLFSGFLGGRSGNRGRCAQPCRLEYSAYLKDRDKKAEQISDNREKCLLSMRDMCTLGIIPELIEAGITSFKIEGRMKKSEYAYFSTSIYRKYIDLYESGKSYEVSESDLRALRGNYIRTEISEGYYHTCNGPELITLKKGGYNEHDIILGDLTPDPVRIKGRAHFEQGKPATLELTAGESCVKACGDVCQKAISSALSEERIARQLEKTGGSGFVFEDLRVKAEGEVFLPMKSLNELRRRALELLKEELLSEHRRELTDSLQAAESKDHTSREKNKVTGKSADAKTLSAPRVSVLCETKGQLKAALEYAGDLDRIYIESDLWLENSKELFRLFSEKKSGEGGFDTKVFLALPYIIRAKDEDRLKSLLDSMKASGPVEGLLLRNYEELGLVTGKNGGMITEACRQYELVADFGLYSFNSSACLRLEEEGIDILTVPLELTLSEMKERGFMEKSELFLYGRAPMMISAGCILKTLGRCVRDRGEMLKDRELFLKDRYNKELPVIKSCSFCYNRILNPHPTFIGKYAASSGASILRIQFSDESEKESRDILSVLLPFIAGKSEEGIALLSERTTRGHIRAGVE